MHTVPLEHIDTIAFDADDTLWHNEDGFHHVGEQFAQLIAPFVSPETKVLELLAQRERENVKVFGYGVKSSTFSMIETANELTRGSIGAHDLAVVTDKIIEMGRWLLTRETVVFNDAQQVLSQLNGNYRLLLITKGDQHHQLSKVDESGLSDHFDHIEVVNEKDVATYQGLASQHRYDLAGFLMVGNSVKSDILPVLDAGGTAAHIPYHLTWDLEVAEIPDSHPGRSRFIQLSSLREVLHLCPAEEPS
jgi:putative hydrolase of the HAD superfamily